MLTAPSPWAYAIVQRKKLSEIWNKIRKPTAFVENRLTTPLIVVNAENSFVPEIKRCTIFAGKHLVAYKHKPLFKWKR